MNVYLRIWLLAQLAALGTCDKRRLALRHYRDQQRILEIGCAVGNVSMAFRKFQNIDFVGVDVDSRAIAIARSLFRDDSRFRFVAGPAQSLIGKQEPFDLVLVAGVLHHVDDNDALGLINAAAQLVLPTGSIVISEPHRPRSTDTWFVRLFGLLELGKWRREPDELIALAEKAEPKLTVKEAKECFISPSIFGWPDCVRFSLIKLARA